MVFSGEAGAPVLSSSSCTRGRDTRVRGNAGKKAVLLLDETTQASGESCRARSYTHSLLICFWKKEKEKRKKSRVDRQLLGCSSRRGAAAMLRWLHPLLCAGRKKKKKKQEGGIGQVGLLKLSPPAKSPTAPHSLASNSGETASACCHARIRRDDGEMLQFSSIRHR